METRPFGNTDLKVSRIGLGCMGMSDFYGAHDDAESLDTLLQAIDIGVNFFDTADMYGNGQNEALLGTGIKLHRDEVVIATKFGIVLDNDKRSINGRPEYVKTACDASLHRLKIDTIDLYYLHRVDPHTPIEDTVGAMADLVSAGKVRYLGLSEVSADTLRRAMNEHPIAAVQSEYSLWSRDPEAGILDACREHGVAFVAYSPLGRGFLTGRIRSFEDLDEDDWRRRNPRFQGRNFEANLALVDAIEEMAEYKGCTPAQLALAWLLAQGKDVFPIPGTRRVERLKENAAALEIEITRQDLDRLEEIAPPGAADGERYPEEAMRSINA
ncbi:MAG: aldo/keto reductase [Gammaproteobacteria bacterium]|nr:aldo/keto reductase [Gammaproteobacteria bacterium]